MISTDTDMIDEVFEFLLDILLEFVPTIVWKLLLAVIGVVATAVGVAMFEESPQMGGALIAVGVVLLVGLLISAAR